MAQLCRGCQKLGPPRRSLQSLQTPYSSRSPLRPTLRPRIWTLAVVLVGLLVVTSTFIAAAVLTHQTLPWTRRLNLESRSCFPPAPCHLSRSRWCWSKLLARFTRTPSCQAGAQNLEEAKRAMSDPAIERNYANIDFARLKQVKLTENRRDMFRTVGVKRSTGLRRS